MILKEIVNKKLDTLIRSYEMKNKRSNYLYSRQLTNLTSFLDNAKIQIDLMQNHIKKQTEASSNNNKKYSLDVAENEEEEEIEDEALLNM